MINLSLSKPQFDLELARTESPQPEDVFAAVKQNVWHINIDQNNTAPDVYDDTYRLNGGGQIAEARSESGGILYHALINTRFEYSDCSLNPTNGVAFIQNIKAGSSIDLGNITMEFRDNCDGKAHVKLATGKYVSTNGRDVNLHFD